MRLISERRLKRWLGRLHAPYARRARFKPCWVMVVESGLWHLHGDHQTGRAMWKARRG